MWLRKRCLIGYWCPRVLHVHPSCDIFLHPAVGNFVHRLWLSGLWFIFSTRNMHHSGILKDSWPLYSGIRGVKLSIMSRFHCLSWQISQPVVFAIILASLLAIHLQNVILDQWNAFSLAHCCSRYFSNPVDKSICHSRTETSFKICLGSQMTYSFLRLGTKILVSEIAIIKRPLTFLHKKYVFLFSKIFS